MSSARRPSPHSKKPSAQDAGDKPPVQFLPPLRARPVLTAILFAALILWLGASVLMRFTTVKPYTTPAPTAATNP